MTTTPVSALVLAAGKGVRMKSALPKVLHPVLGRPLAHWSIHAALDAGAAPVVVVVGHGKDEVEASLAAFGARTKSAYQAEQRGTGHAAQVGLAVLGATTGTVLVLYGDTPLLRADTLRALAALRAESRAPLAMLVMELDDPTGYGRIVRDDEGRVLKIVEHKDARDEERAITEVNPGIYAVEAGFLARALAGLKDQNAQKELYLTDIVARATEEMSQDSDGIPTMRVSPDETRGVNDRRELAIASEILRDRMVAHHMKDGVSFELPSSTWVEADVAIGADTTIGPHCVLRSGTRIGAWVVVEAGSVIAKSMIDDEAVIHAYSVLDEARVGKGASVGPFARLRPEAVLDEGARVGNFVEVKKSRLGKGAKANHLAYLGDAEIGAGSNVGAGTITCNYDGIGKHKTTLGERVFIGSNATLVAPLAIDDDAYVAAGSTVSRAVPKDALAIARAQQENKEGYAKKIRARNEARKNAKK